MSEGILIAVVFLCAFVFVFGLALALNAIRNSERAVVKKRFDHLNQNLQNRSPYNQSLAQLKEENNWHKYEVFSRFPPMFNLPLLFEQAGYKCDVKQWCVQVFALGAFVGIIIGYFSQSMQWGILAGILFLLLPYLLIQYKRSQRINRFESMFAQSLEVISRSLKAGHPLSMGLKMVSSEMPDPIGMEFERIFYEHQMGLPLDESLRQLAQRVPLLDVRFFVLTILIHNQTGGDLSEVIDNLSSVIRDRFKVLGQVKALTAEGRLSGWVLRLLPVFVFFIILAMNPEYGTLLLKTDLGNKMLFTSLIMQFIGILMIRKIVNIKV